MAAGIFITLEGGEGAGKSTQIALLEKALCKRGRRVVRTREPGGTEGAEAIRKLLVEGAVRRWDNITELLLHYAARRDHYVNKIEPELKRGSIVISDRFADSTMAYQGYGRGVRKDLIAAVHKAAIGKFKPRLTLILDIPVEVGLRRAIERGGKENRYERMGKAFHQRLRRGFLAIAEAEPRRCKIIDATRDIDAIHHDILKYVLAVLR